LEVCDLCSVTHKGFANRRQPSRPLYVATGLPLVSHLASIKPFERHERSLAIVTIGVGGRGQRVVEIDPAVVGDLRRSRRHRLAEGGSKHALWHRSRGCRLMVLSFRIISPDSPARSARSRCPALGKQMPSSCKLVRTIAAIVRIVPTIARKNKAIFAAHGAMMRSSAALWQSVLVT
jgi:hypothetical protein